MRPALYYREYRKKNKERVNTLDRLRYMKNRDSEIAETAKWRLAHPERVYAGDTMKKWGLK
ncbi:MAG: hypothetical protein GY861_00095, partial [bacterium]|nr:hypothetical protein [bacterium]